MPKQKRNMGVPSFDARTAAVFLYRQGQVHHLPNLSLRFGTAVSRRSHAPTTRKRGADRHHGDFSSWNHGVQSAPSSLWAYLHAKRQFASDMTLSQLYYSCGLNGATDKRTPLPDLVAGADKLNAGVQARKLAWSRTQVRDGSLRYAIHHEDARGIRVCRLG